MPSAGRNDSKIFRGHILGIYLDVDDRGFPGGLIGAIEMRRGGSNLERRGIEHAGIFAQVVFGIEINGDRNASGGTTGYEECLGNFYVALGLRFATLRGKIGGEIEKAAETGARIDEAGRTEIERVHLRAWHRWE